MDRRDFLKLSVVPLLGGGLTFALQDEKDLTALLVQGSPSDANLFKEIVLARVEPNWRKLFTHWEKSDGTAYCLRVGSMETLIFEPFFWAAKNCGLHVTVQQELPLPNWSRVDIIAFDLFGTVFKLDRPKEEIEDYARQISGKWAPLKLPKEWGELDPYEDAAEGLSLLSSIAHTVTFSNCPVDMQRRLGCPRLFNELVDLARYEVYKPSKEAYRRLPKYLGVKPSQILVVSSNEGFGDLEGAREAGMQSLLLDRRRKYWRLPQNLIQLAQKMLASL